MRWWLGLLSLTSRLCHCTFLTLNEHNDLLKYRKSWCHLVEKTATTSLGTIAVTRKSVLCPSPPFSYYSVWWLPREHYGSDFKKKKESTKQAKILIVLWMKFQNLETSVFQWCLETETKWLRPWRCSQKCFYFFLFTGRVRFVERGGKNHKATRLRVVDKNGKWVYRGKYVTVISLYSLPKGQFQL